MADPGLASDLGATARRLAVWLAGRQGLTGSGGDVDSDVDRNPDSDPRCTLEPSAGGFSNLTWLGRWQPGAGRAERPIVLRVQSSVPTVFPDPSIDRQVRVMAALAGSDVPVPRLLGHEADTAALGSPFCVMERVPGRVPAENPLYHREGWLHDLDEEALHRHWFSGIDTLAAIAAVDWQARGLGFLSPPEGVAALTNQLQDWQAMLSWVEAGARAYPHLHAAHDWLLRHQPPPGRLCLSWGDAKLGNCVFAEDGRVAAALDWEQATLADPVDDLAWWLMLDDCLSDGYGVPRLAGLPERAQTVTYWERATGCSAHDLPYHEVFAAWRMAIIMARIGTLFTARGWVAAEAEMDRRNGAATLLARHAQRLGF